MIPMLEKLKYTALGAFPTAILTMIVFAFLFKSCTPEKLPVLKTEESPRSGESFKNVGTERDTVTKIKYRDRVVIAEAKPDTVIIRDTVEYSSPAFTAILDSISPNNDTAHVEFEFPAKVFKNIFFGFAPDSIITITEQQYYQQVIERLPYFQTYAFVEADYNITRQVAPAVGLGVAANVFKITMNAEARSLVKDGSLLPFLKARAQYNF